MKLTAWQLYRRNFKDGDQVIFVDDDNCIGWGKLVDSTADGFRIDRTRVGRIRFIYWDQIRFMAHDGFPVRQLFGADGSNTIEQAPTAVEALRRGLQEEFLSSHIVFGDPFMIEDAVATLHYPGNEGPKWWGQDGEECLELVTVDGARGMLWDLPTVFHVEFSRE